MLYYNSSTHWSSFVHALRQHHAQFLMAALTANPKSFCCFFYAKTLIEVSLQHALAVFSKMSEREQLISA